MLLCRDRKFSVLTELISSKKKKSPKFRPPGIGASHLVILFGLTNAPTIALNESCFPTVCRSVCHGIYRRHPRVFKGSGRS